MKQGTKRAHARSKQSAGKKSDSSRHNQDINPKSNAFNKARDLFEKFTALAREALIAGDRILAEGHYQQAEHHLRQSYEVKEKIPTSKNKPLSSPPNLDFEKLIEQELAAQMQG